MEMVGENSVRMRVNTRFLIKSDAKRTGKSDRI